MLSIRPSSTSLAAMLLSFLIGGCAPSTPAEPEAATTNEQSEVPEQSKPPEIEVIADPESAVDLVEEAAKSVRRNDSGQIIEVDLSAVEVTPEVLAALPQLTRLRSLLLRESTLEDSGLQEVGKCAALENLDLRECSIGNDGLEHLTGLKKLKALRLSGQSGATTVDDAGLETLGQLPQLKVLAFDFLWVSGEGLQKLNPLKGLRELYLAGTLVGDSDLETLGNFPELRKLRLSKLSQLSGQGVTEIAKLKHLEELDLSEDSSLANADIEPLGEMTSLKKLNLWRVPISDDGVLHLKPLTGLVWLNLDNTQLSDAGLPALQGMKNLEFLHLGSTQISNAGLSSLSGLKSLDKLVVTRTAVTEEGVDELQPKLPDTEIQLKYLGNN